MKLEKFLRDNGISYADFALKIHVSEFSVERYCKGRVPRPPMLYKIHMATGGSVQPNDFFDLPQKRSK